MSLSPNKDKSVGFPEIKNLKEVLGNQPSIDILKKWLSTFDSELKKLKAKKLKNFSRAALISGPTGIGHTLITKLLSKEYSYKIITFDCSCCKPTKPKTKEPLDSVTYISEIQVSKSFFKKLIVFESGSSITGAMSTQLINLIKKTQVPIIINCNDPYPLKTLSNYCLHIKLKRPSKIQIVNYLIDKKIVPENEKETVLKEIETQGSDIRHIVSSYIHGITPSKDSNGQLNLFTATEQIFNSDSFKEKENAFWEDYSMVPLMVQQNYIRDPTRYSEYTPEKQLETLESIAEASDSLSDYEVVSEKAGPGSWSLLPMCCSLIIRTTILSNKKVSSFPGSIQFSEYLGRYSRERSLRERNTELAKQVHMSPIEYRLTIVPFLYSYFMNLLNIGSKETIEKAFLLLKKYHLTRDDLFDVIEKSCLDKITIESKKKSAFTRYYNKVNKSK
jgi:replication factor C subunit 1